jgi:2,3-diketo-5-methylthio-1-phosphopentane phosphatase
MSDTSHKKPILFLDFDGTVSERDAIDAVLEAFADSSWLAVEEEWKAGRMGSRECLRAQMALVRASPREVNAVLDTIKVDRGFEALLKTCSRHRVPVHIVSDGFDYCIRRILARSGHRVTEALSDVRVFSSQLKPEGESWRVEFPFFTETCEHGCATCKPAVIRRLNRGGAPTIFVGDGLSDRYAAESADFIFAKKRLADFCRERGIAHVAYEDLCKVAAYLESLLRADAVGAGEMAEPIEA